MILNSHVAVLFDSSFWWLEMLACLHSFTEQNGGGRYTSSPTVDLVQLVISVMV